MRAKVSAILTLTLLIALLCGTGCTDTGKYAVSAKTGTLGLGGEFTTAIAPDINARIGLNALDVDIDDIEVEDVDFDIGVDLSSFSALADWYVFDGSFRLSGGIIAMDNELDLEARGRSGTLQEIGDVQYDWDEIGTLHGKIDNDEVVPYIGIGWGNPLTSNRRWGFTCDFGIAFTSSPDVDLYATSSIKPPGFDEELAKLRDDIEDVFDGLDFYPVIAVNFFYRF